MGTPLDSIVTDMVLQDIDKIALDLPIFPFTLDMLMISYLQPFET